MLAAMRRDPLACPRCGSASGSPGELGTRICEGCELEFRPRARVPLRVATRPSPGNDGLLPWLVFAVIVGVVAGVVAFGDSPPSSIPPEVVLPPPRIEIDTIEALALGPSPMEGPSLAVVEQRRELGEGRVRVTGLIAVPSRAASQPRVAVVFVAADGLELGRVQAEVACERIAELPCPFAFVGLVPPGTVDLALTASGGAEWLSDIDPRAQLRFGFDAAGEPTTCDVDRPAHEGAVARLELHDDHAKVGVGLPLGQRVRDARAVLVGFGEASVVELVLPLPSPIGLTREVELPTPVPAIVRWQLWVSGRVEAP